MAAILLFGVMAAGLSTSVQAHGRRYSSHLDFYIGTPRPWWPSPYYRYHPYYYEPRTIIIEREPPVYIQRQPSQVTQPVRPPPPVPAQVWYYCTDPADYYPYVQNCNQAWVRVDPRTVAPAPPR